jgi:hypothetical protein
VDHISIRLSFVDGSNAPNLLPKNYDLPLFEGLCMPSRLMVNIHRENFVVRHTYLPREILSICLAHWILGRGRSAFGAGCCAHGCTATQIKDRNGST